MKTLHPNFSCPQCGNTKHYAKGLCKACYARKRHRILCKSSDFPVNLILKLGITEEDVTDDMMERMENLLYSGILKGRDSENIIVDIFKNHKTAQLIANEYGCTRQNISAIKLRSLEILSNPVCLDYLYGSIENISDVSQHFKLRKRITEPAPTPVVKKTEPDYSTVFVDEQLKSYEEKLEKIQGRLNKVRKEFEQRNLIRDCADAPCKIRRALNKIGIKTIADLMLASKLLPQSKALRKSVYDDVVKWAESIGITIGEELGIDMTI